MRASASGTTMKSRFSARCGVYELPAPVEVVAAIKLHLSPNPLLGFLHE